jgi:hypothetical protein
MSGVRQRMKKKEGKKWSVQKPRDKRQLMQTENFNRFCTPGLHWVESGKAGEAQDLM